MLGWLPSERLDRAGVPSRFYRLSTIDGWAIRIISMFPLRSGHNPDMLNLETPGADYPAIRRAAAKLLWAGHINDVLAASYSRLIVDEYQDCNMLQHAMVWFAAQALPTVVLGDHMQAIFTFGGAMPDWDTEVLIRFPVAGELGIRWRWRNAGTEVFGLWLLDTRKRLIAREPIDLSTAPPQVTCRAIACEQRVRRRILCSMRRASSCGPGTCCPGERLRCRRLFVGSRRGSGGHNPCGFARRLRGRRHRVASADDFLRSSACD